MKRRLIWILAALAVLVASGCGEKKVDQYGRRGVVTGKRYAPAMGEYGERYWIDYKTERGEPWYAPVDSTDWHEYEVGDRYPR